MGVSPTVVPFQIQPFSTSMIPWSWSMVINLPPVKCSEVVLEMSGYPFVQFPRCARLVSIFWGGQAGWNHIHGYSNLVAKWA